MFSEQTIDIVLKRLQELYVATNLWKRKTNGELTSNEERALIKWTLQDTWFEWMWNKAGCPEEFTAKTFSRICEEATELPPQYKDIQELKAYKLSEIDDSSELIEQKKIVAKLKQIFQDGTNPHV